MRQFCHFDTALGSCGLLWSPKGIERLQLPDIGWFETHQLLTREQGICLEVKLALAPEWVQDTICRVRILLVQGRANFSDIPLNLSRISPFFEKVYAATRKIPAGQTITYGTLAQTIGSKGAARAVGTALGRNPVPLIIPCHRVVGSGGRLGGFSAYGGTLTKQRLLDIEFRGT